MSAITATTQCYDFLSHCDSECKHVITPYFNGVQRTLLEEHNHKSYYSIPFVIKSICCAYYCKHLHYRLSFKSLFTYHPTPSHLSHNVHCSQNWKSCSSIQRILHILTNFQEGYLQSIVSSQDAISPYVTYKGYQMQQILRDISHINRKHPQNTVKFYIRNRIIPHHAFGPCEQEKEDGGCACADFTFRNDTEQILKYNIRNIHQQLVHHCESKIQFEYAVSHIITCNPSQAVFRVLKTLRSVATKLLRNDIRYRTLPTSNVMFQERLMGFEGVLPFLSLLGFESNAMGTKLICDHPPSTHVITTALSVIDAYHPEIQPVNVQQTIRDTNHNYGGVHFVAKSSKKSQRLVMVNGRSRCFKHRSGSLELRCSDTECVDIEDEIAVSMMKRLV